MDSSSEDNYIICIFNYRKTNKINLWPKLCYITLCVCLGWGRGLYEWKWNLREKNSIFENEFQFYALIVLCNMLMLLVAPSSQLIVILIKKIKLKRVKIISVNLVYQQPDCFLFLRSPIPWEHHCRGSAG